MGVVVGGGGVGGGERGFHRERAAHRQNRSGRRLCTATVASGAPCPLNQYNYYIVNLVTAPRTHPLHRRALLLRSQSRGPCHPSARRTHNTSSLTLAVLFT